jgi:hypothetical protein
MSVLPLPNNLVSQSDGQLCVCCKHGDEALICIVYLVWMAFQFFVCFCVYNKDRLFEPFQEFNL